LCNKKVTTFFRSATRRNAKFEPHCTSCNKFASLGLISHNLKQFASLIRQFRCHAGALELATNLAAKLRILVSHRNGWGRSTASCTSTQRGTCGVDVHRSSGRRRAVVRGVDLGGLAGLSSLRSPPRQTRRQKQIRNPLRGIWERTPIDFVCASNRQREAAMIFAVHSDL